MPQSAVIRRARETISVSPKRVFDFSLLLQKEEVTDWRKNVEAMSGMEGRKKLFDAGQ